MRMRSTCTILKSRTRRASRFQGELIAKLSAPPRCTLDLGRPGPCAFVSAALASLVCVVATEGPDTTAEGAPDTETTAEAEAEAVGRALATEASSDGAPALARFDLDATLLACYPHVTGLPQIRRRRSSFATYSPFARAAP